MILSSVPRDNTASDDYISLASEFLSEHFPATEPQTQVANHLLGCMLTGSTMYESLDNHRDIDLILFIPVAVDGEFDIPHVLSTEYNGEKIEMNVMTDERLERAARRKDYLDTFSNGQVVWAATDEIANLILQAGRVTNREKQAILWTNYCQFEIDGSAQKRDLDGLSDAVLTEKRIRLFAESVLAEEEIFVREKWLGKILADIDEDAYAAATRKDFDTIREQFRTLLIRNGFTAEELDNWKQSNADLLRFRRH